MSVSKLRALVKHHGPDQEVSNEIAAMDGVWLTQKKAGNIFTTGILFSRDAALY